MTLTYNDSADYYGTLDGVIVDAVEADSSADRIGVQAADLLRTLDDVPVHTPADVCAILRDHQEGDTLQSEFLRLTETERQVLTGELVLGNPPASVALNTLTVVEQQPFMTIYDFAAPTEDWWVGTSAGISAEIDTEFYQVALTEPDRSFVIPSKAVDAGTSLGIATDVYLHEDVWVGLAMRYSAGEGKPSYYACWIDTTQQYGCFMVVDGEPTNLVGPAVNDTIKPDEFNMITLAILDEQLTFKINGEEVARYTLDHLLRGVPVIYVENFTTPAGASFETIVISQ